jgi:hypothetical protein
MTDPFGRLTCVVELLLGTFSAEGSTTTAIFDDFSVWGISSAPIRVIRAKRAALGALLEM